MRHMPKASPPRAVLHGLHAVQMAAGVLSAQDEKGERQMNKIPEPEFDADGYPTEKTLATIKKWTFAEGYNALMLYVWKAWNYQEYITIKDTKNTFGDDIFEHTLVTSGWSGNEDIIAALGNNRVFYAMCWRESHRGGKHVYEVKKAQKGKR